MMVSEKSFMKEELPFVSCTGTDSFSPLFYDIETTGLSPERNHVYLAGILFYDGGAWQLRQWLSRDPAEEPELLQAFSDCVRTLCAPSDHDEPSSLHTCIDFNGTTFDRPFLKKRFARYAMEDPFTGIPSVDLYRTFAPLKKLLSLSSFRQSDLEARMGQPDRLYPDGRDCIRVYRSYERSTSEGSRRVLLGHNEEDLKGLASLTTLYPLLALTEGAVSGSASREAGAFWEIRHAESDGAQAVFHLCCKEKIPCALRLQEDDWSLLGPAGQNDVVYSVRLRDGRLRQYYADYKDYAYLPDEDYAVPKSISRFLGKDVKRPATRDTCYTWFPCTEDFLKDPQKLTTYLKSALRYSLS